MIEKAEKALFKSEEKYRTLFNSIDQGFLLGELIRNNDGKGIDYFVHEVNSTYEKQTGINAEMVLGKTVLQSFPTIDKWWIETYASVVDNQYPVRFEKFFEFTNRWFEIKATPAGEDMFIILFTDITERIQAVEKIKESEERFRSIADDAPVFIFLAGENAEVDYLNKTWQEYTGTSTEDSNGRAWTEITHPDDIDPTTKIYMDGFNNRVSCSFENRQKGTDGIYRTILWRATPRFSINGQFIGMMGVGFDIDERKKSEEKLQESEERFRSFAQTLPQLVWVADAKGNAEFASFRWKEYSGINPGGEKEWRAIVHPDDYDGINEAWVHSLTTGNIYTFDVRLKSKDGEYRWHTVKGEPVLDKEGKIVKWVGSFTDIHEQKQASDKIEQRERQFSTLANNIQNLAWIADGEGYIYWYNQRWYDYTGTTLEEMKGWGWEKVHHSEHANRVVDFVKKAWQINEPFELTFPLRRHDGEYRWFLTRAYPVTNEAGTIINWIGTNTDITEQKTFAEQLEEKVNERTAELNVKNEELEKLNKELESFNFISSHDLQEPLRQIQNFSSRIIDTEKQNLTDKGKTYFQKINNSASRMQTLIADLLAYSRTKTQERKFEITDLNIIVEQAKNELKETIEERHATIEVGDMCSAKVIPFQLLQLMHNLIGNALKFSKPEIAPHIIIKSNITKGSKLNNDQLSPALNYCHITVSDNGIGFNQQYSEKIFEVFQRLHGKHEYDGTGIGLSIVKKIVENHNGIITASSELNKGATFDIFIPVT